MASKCRDSFDFQGWSRVVSVSVLMGVLQAGNGPGCVLFVKNVTHIRKGHDTHRYPYCMLRVSVMSVTLGVCCCGPVCTDMCCAELSSADLVACLTRHTHVCVVMGGGGSFTFTLMTRPGVQGHTYSLHHTHMGVPHVDCEGPCPHVTCDPNQSSAATRQKGPHNLPSTGIEPCT
jgi:hypothetical protein